MTKKIRTTDAHLLAFLRKTVSTLFERYEQLESHSEYWISFERETRDTYSLSFWRKPEGNSAGIAKVEIPLTSVTDHLWLECCNKTLDDLSQRIFSVPVRPYMTFKLTFQVVNKGTAPLIVLKTIKPGGFGDYRLTSEPNYEARTATA